MTTRSFNKILIANRGEIACRIIRTAHKLGIRTVAVYSDADRNALHVTMADEAVHIGASPSKDSYLDANKVIAAAIKTGAEAIHPGYGFLSENSNFCSACKDKGIVFIGPPIPAIEAMGSKSAAKTIMEKAKVPLVPGYHGEDQNPDILKSESNKIGYPVLLKAVSGGGGKGMRQIWKEAEFDEALAAAKREATNSFGDDAMLVEKYLTEPRHVEIQVFCDQQGNALYLFERDCSVQRRHQKVIEEAPAPGLSEALRQAMGETAIRAAKAINYEGAGTVEFLLDKDGSFYFMEMNTRLQVEHPVTEMISGQDLVEWQLRVAAGENLPLSQDELKISGHAFEARIYAEDPDNDFLPVTGSLTYLQTPETNEHVRVDTGVRQGDEISVYYDPMIAKLIVWDENRSKALQRLTKALQEYNISGTTTNIEFLYNLASCKAFQDADLDTGFIEKNHDAIFHDKDSDFIEDIPLAALYLVLRQSQNANITVTSDAYSPWNSASAWRMNEPHLHRFTIGHHEQEHEVSIEQLRQGETIIYQVSIDNDLTDKAVETRGYIENNQLFADINGHQVKARIAEHNEGFSLYTQDKAISFKLIYPDTGDASLTENTNNLTAPMNGTMVTLLVKPGSKVKKEDPLLIMEAMKMEHTIRAPTDGTVHTFYFQPGELVDGGVELVDFEVKENQD